MVRIVSRLIKKQITTTTATNVSPNRPTCETLLVKMVFSHVLIMFARQQRDCTGFSPKITQYTVPDLVPFPWIYLEKLRKGSVWTVHCEGNKIGHLQYCLSIDINKIIIYFQRHNHGVKRKHPRFRENFFSLK